MDGSRHDPLGRSVFVFRSNFSETIVYREIQQDVKIICLVSLKMPTARSNVSEIEQLSGSGESRPSYNLFEVEEGYLKLRRPLLIQELLLV